MPQNTHDPILSILKAYERDPSLNNKKAVLLTSQGGYFLYGNRFCSILDYELELQSSSCQIQGKSVKIPLFFGQIHDTLHAVGAETGELERLSLIFHIDLGEDELLRGVLLAVKHDFQFALFCDEAVEKLYRLACRTRAGPGCKIPPDESLQQYAENLRRRDLHGLTGLYLQSKAVKSGHVEN